MLIRHGVGYREFSEVAKATFVEVASDDYGIRGRKTNMSRVAVMTGLSRKEIKRIRDARSSGELTSITNAMRARRPEQILTIWHTDPDFQDRDGRPKPIPLDGANASFMALVSRVGGDIPPKAMLNELLRAGSIAQEGERFRVLSESYVPEPHDPEAILLGGGALRHLATTINYNLGSEDPERRFFERRVYSDRLADGQRAKFKKLAREKSDLLLRDFHAWLTERESAPEDLEIGDSNSVIGVGVYFFDDAVEPDDSSELR
ncbi:hypothetical protein G6N75_13860 [Thioalkalivibrio sp. XN8]|nr:hypothetical protein [Thioalkalivibrio sp. XN8]